MRSRTATVAAAVTLGLGGLAGGLVLAPAVATAVTSEQGTAQAAGERVQRLEDALQGLVEDGTLEAAQRDAVAERLAGQVPPRGHGRGQWHGHGHEGRRVALDVAADVLGTTQDALRSALRDGRSLADVAREKGVDEQALVDALVTAAQERLTRAVEAGRLTQEQADQRRAGLEQRVQDTVERPGRPRRGPEPPDHAPDAPDAQTEPSSYSA